MSWLRHILNEGSSYELCFQFEWTTHSTVPVYQILSLLREIMALSPTLIICRWLYSIGCQSMLYGRNPNFDTRYLSTRTQPQGHLTGFPKPSDICSGKIFKARPCMYKHAHVDCIYALIKHSLRECLNIPAWTWTYGSVQSNRGKGMAVIPPPFEVLRNCYFLQILLHKHVQTGMQTLMHIHTRNTRNSY